MLWTSRQIRKPWPRMSNRGERATECNVFMKFRSPTTCSDTPASSKNDGQECPIAASVQPNATFFLISDRQPPARIGRQGRKRWPRMSNCGKRATECNVFLKFRSPTTCSDTPANSKTMAKNVQSWRACNRMQRFS